MTSKFRKQLIVAGLLVSPLAWAAPPAQQAQTTYPEWYAALSVSSTRYADYTGDVNSLILTSVQAANPGRAIAVSSNQDTTSAGGKFAVGAWINDNVAFELGYASLGKSKLTSATTGVVTSWDITQENGATFGNVLLGGKVDANSRLYAKLGVYRANTKLSVSASGTAGTAFASTSSDNTGGVFGLGWDYMFNDKVGARLEYEQFNKVGDTNKTGQGSVNALSLGLVFKF